MRPLIAAALLAAVVVGGISIGVLRVLTDTAADW